MRDWNNQTSRSRTEGIWGYTSNPAPDLRRDLWDWILNTLRCGGLRRSDGGGSDVVAHVCRLENSADAGGGSILAVKSVVPPQEEEVVTYWGL
jgi:hypothetical protein